MQSFLENISGIGNAINEPKSYYNRLADYLQNEGLNDDDVSELAFRIESFIEQEIEELKK
tara:strand:- start:1772 stop:1951 length:180 start_codon:yes stop_codon:yes gene_type:complete